MAMDAAFLDELSAFLNASDLPLIHTPWNVNHDNFIPFGTSEIASVSPFDSPTISNGNTVITVETCMNNDIHMAKFITKREKEVLRKQRYQMRLKNERDTLRKMKIELSLQLEKLGLGNVNRVVMQPTRLHRGEVSLFSNANNDYLWKWSRSSFMPTLVYKPRIRAKCVLVIEDNVLVHCEPL